MPSPADAIGPIKSCLSGDNSGGLTMVWPSLGFPGLPEMALGSFSSMFAGVNFVLGFIPPDPGHLPTLPTVDFFTAPFASAAGGMPGFPSFAIGGFLGIPSVSMPGIGVPGFGGSGHNIPLPGFDPGVMLKMLEVMVLAPFLIIKGIVTSILNLSLEIPGLSTITGIIVSIGVAVGLSASAIAFFAGCLAKGFVSLLSVL